MPLKVADPSYTGFCVFQIPYVFFTFCLFIVNKENMYLKIRKIIDVRWSWSLTGIWFCPLSLTLFSTSPIEKTAESTYLYWRLNIYQCLHDQAFNLQSSHGLSIMAAKVRWAAISTSSIKNFFNERKLISVRFCTKAIAVKNCGFVFWFWFGFFCPKLVLLEAKCKQSKKAEIETK